MPIKKNEKTAEELMRELEADPQWVAERNARDARRALRAERHERDEASIIQELKAVGISVTSVYQFVGKSIAPAAAFPILLRHLDVEHLPNVREGLIRALGVPAAKGIAFDRLCQLFIAENDPVHRWAIANALSGMAHFNEVNHLNGMNRYAELF